jgi:hypothetical protein
MKKNITYKKANSNWNSQAVSHPSTIMAKCCLRKEKEKRNKQTNKQTNRQTNKQRIKKQRNKQKKELVVVVVFFLVYIWKPSGTTEGDTNDCPLLSN